MIILQRYLKLFFRCFLNDGIILGNIHLSVYFDFAFTIGGFDDFYPDGNALGHLGNVGDNADFASLCLEMTEGIHGYTECVTVK